MNGVHDPIEQAVRTSSGLRRIVANFTRLASGKAAAGLVSLLYLVIATRLLGARDYGVLVLIHAYAVLVGGIVAFSGFHGVVRYGTLSLERDDRAGFARMVRFLAVVELAFGAAAIAIAALLVPWAGPRLGLSPAAMPFAMPYALAVIATVRATPQGLLQIAGRFDLVGLHHLVSPLVRLAGTLIVWATGGGLQAFIVVWLAAAIAEGIGMWLIAVPTWRKLAGGERWRGGWRGAAREHAGLVRFVATSNLDLTVRELAPNLAPVTIGWALGPAAAGLFALAQRGTNLVAQPAAMLSQASYSVLAAQAARHDTAALTRTVWHSAWLALGAAIVLVGALVVSGGRLLTLLGGGSFAAGSLLLALVATARGIGLATAPLAAALSAMGHPQRPLAVGLATGLGLFPLLPLLLGWAGVDGAGWHALLQAAVGAATLLLLFAMAVREDASTGYAVPSSPRRQDKA